MAKQTEKTATKQTNTEKTNTEKTNTEKTENTVRVSNMSEMTNEEQVRALFDQAGQVKDVQMVTDASGKSVGAAFVQLRNQSEVDKAIHLLHGKQYDNHTLDVTPV